jgi:hypothetical protein
MNLLPQVSGEITARSGDVFTEETRPHIEALASATKGAILHAADPHTPVAIVAQYKRNGHSSYPILQAGMEILSHGPSTLTSSTFLQIPEHWKGLAARAFAHILEDPRISLTAINTLSGTSEWPETWKATFVPSGLIFMRHQGNMTLASQSQDEFQQFLDDNFRIVITDAASAHANLRQIEKFQTLVSRIIVKASIDSTGRDPEARFTPPKITIRNPRT